jgi:succinyl-CoA synthetase alpha subunit
MSVLLDNHTRVMITGITGGQARRHLIFMREYGTKIVCGVSPGKGGQDVEGVPVYDTTRTALEHHEVDIALIFLGARSALEGALEAIENGVKTVVVHEDGVPQFDTALLLKRAKEKGVRIIGPNSQGMVSPGKAKVGGSGGDVMDQVFKPGPVGVISRSGGMGIETCIHLTKNNIGQSTFVAIGGDLMIGTTMVDLLAEFEQDPETQVVVLFGEAGTRYEEEAAEFILAGKFTKPVVAYIAGEQLEKLPREMSFGHTRSLISRGDGTVSEKKQILQKAGVRIAQSFTDIAGLVKEAL